MSYVVLVTRNDETKLAYDNVFDSCDDAWEAGHRFYNQSHPEIRIAKLNFVGGIGITNFLQQGYNLR